MSWPDHQLQTLKEMNQWVCWGYRMRDGDKTKPPLAPFDDEYNAKSDDPSTWGSYEQAVEYHAREDTDTEGIGFMLSEQDLIVGVDLDGCRHPETGELEPWAEQIVETADTYTEVSPSGTGLRLFAVGILPDGRRRRDQERTLDLPEWVDKDSEIEIYDDVRYMTYTGDQLEGTPDDVQKRASAVKEIHAEYVADGESSGSSGSTEYEHVDVSDDGTDEYTNEFGTSLEQIREWDEKLDKLLSRIEPNVSLPNEESASEYDYSATVKLLYWRFEDRDIANILRRYRGREKMNRDDYVQRTIANAKSDQTEKCDAPQNRNVESIEQPSEAKVALDAMLSLYESDPDRDMDHESEIWAAVGKIDPDDVEDFTGRVADVLDASEYAVKNHARLDSHEREHGSIVVEDGKTWYIDGTPKRKYELLNFELDVQSYLKVERGPLHAQLKASLETGETFEKPVEPKIFNRKERFDDEILGESFGTKFTVPNVYDKTVYVQDLLDALRMWVHHQDAPRRLGARHMGLYGDEFVIPGHALGPDGWLEDPSTVYLEQEFGVERRVQMPTDRDEFDQESVREIVETVPFTRDMERLLPVLGWFYAAPLRPVILELSKSGEFNHLNITGDTGSGKTTTLGYLWRCFGMGGEPFSVDMSLFAMMATYSATNSIPLWFDEYKPSDVAGWKLDKFHDLYRKATRGAYTERGNQDRTTDSYKIDAPVVVSGEQAIQGPAERRRTVMTQFRTETTDSGTETAKAYKKLVGKARVGDDGELQLSDDVADPEDHALAYYRFVTGLGKAQVREEWYNALEYAHQFLTNLGVEEEMDDLEIQGVQTVVFGFNMYHRFAETVDADVSKLPGDEELDSALEYVVERIGPKGKRKSHTDQFIELFERAAVAGYVEQSHHYDIVHAQTPREQVRINLPRTYDAISKYAKDHDIRSEDLLNAHGDYRDRFRELSEKPGSYVKCVQQYTPGVSKCTGISTLEAMNKTEFDRASLGLAPMEGDVADTASETDNDGGGGPSATATQETQQAAADGGESETGTTGGESGSEGWNPRKQARVAVDAIPDGKVPIADAANAVAEELGKNLPQAMKLIDKASSEYDFAEKLDGGQKVRRID